MRMLLIRRRLQWNIALSTAMILMALLLWIVLLLRIVLLGVLLRMGRGPVPHLPDGRRWLLSVSLVRLVRRLIIRSVLAVDRVMFCRVDLLMLSCVMATFRDTQEAHLVLAVSVSHVS